MATLDWLCCCREADGTADGAAGVTAGAGRAGAAGLAAPFAAVPELCFDFFLLGLSAFCWRAPFTAADGGGRFLPITCCLAAPGPAALLHGISQAPFKPVLYVMTRVLWDKHCHRLTTTVPTHAAASAHGREDRGAYPGDVLGAKAGSEGSNDVSSPLDPACA